MPTLIRGQSITAPPKVDATLSNTSSNTVQNQAVANALAGAYDATTTYAVGDLCIHDGILNECTIPIATAEAWDATHWKTRNFGDTVSDLNRQLSDVEYGNYYGAQEVNIDKSINTASGVNIIPSSVVTEAGFCCLCIPCVPGDLFIISGSGGSQTRLWAFSDSSGNAIEQATASERATGKELTAPANSAYFAFNSRTNVSYSVYKKQQLIIATTTNDGLMSASDKTKLNDVYADYSSALVALGVI